MRCFVDSSGAIDSQLPPRWCPANSRGAVVSRPPGGRRSDRSACLLDSARSAADDESARGCPAEEHLCARSGIPRAALPLVFPNPGRQRARPLCDVGGRFQGFRMPTPSRLFSRDPRQTSPARRQPRFSSRPRTQDPTARTGFGMRRRGNSPDRKCASLPK